MDQFLMIPDHRFGSMDSFRIFLKTALKDFAIIGNLDERNGCLSNVSGSVFWKTLDLEFWIISG